MNVQKHPKSTLASFITALVALMPLSSAQASTGKLVLTGGVSSVEGSAGGGITPWAVIGTQATTNELGVGTYFSRLTTDDYALNAYGVKFGWDERLELSLGRQEFRTGVTGDALNLPGLRLDQDIIGVKWRVAGDAVLDSDRLMPAIAVGVQHKELDAAGLTPILTSLGAQTSGTDYYASATKLFLKQGILVNGTLRYTEANQNGLLGFGSTGAGYGLYPEISVAKLIRPNLAIGAEYRWMNNDLEAAGAQAGLGNGLASDDWFDVFVAWAPHKNHSLTLGYVNLGPVVPLTTNQRTQDGLYFSWQVAF